MIPTWVSGWPCLGQILERVHRTFVVAGRRVGIARRQEDVVDAGPPQPVDDLGELATALTTRAANM